jgi:hypothetical protein
MFAFWIFQDIQNQVLPSASAPRGASGEGSPFVAPRSRAWKVRPDPRAMSRDMSLNALSAIIDQTPVNRREKWSFGVNKKSSLILMNRFAIGCQKTITRWLAGASFG